MDINYQNPIHLSILIEGQLASERPDALLCPTSNPGDKDERYNCLVFRVYSDKNDLNSFKGYLTFRYNEVGWKRKTQSLPTFSSIEVRDSDFQSYVPTRKIHFDPQKFMADYPTEGADCVSQVVTPQSTPTKLSHTEALKQLIGETALKKAYQLILDLVDGK